MEQLALPELTAISIDFVCIRKSVCIRGIFYDGKRLHTFDIARSGKLTLIVPGDSLKCSLLLKSEAYPIFILLYLSSTALEWEGVN